MNITRRGFAKLFGATVAAALLPAMDSLAATEEGKIWISWMQKDADGPWERQQHVIEGYWDDSEDVSLNVCKGHLLVGHDAGVTVINIPKISENMMISHLQVSTQIPPDFELALYDAAAAWQLQTSTEPVGYFANQFDTEHHNIISRGYNSGWKTL